jgi:hypothetical protein
MVVIFLVDDHETLAWYSRLLETRVSGLVPLSYCSTPSTMKACDSIRIAERHVHRSKVVTRVIVRLHHCRDQIILVVPHVLH